MGSERTPKHNRADRRLPLNERPRCLVNDGHPLFRLGARRVLADTYEVEEAPTRDEAVELIRDVGGFDVAIIDILPWADSGGNGISGSEAIRAIHRDEPRLGIVAHGKQPERHLAATVIAAGASAYLTRTAPAPTCCWRQWRGAAPGRLRRPGGATKGEPRKLTRRQRQILQLLADGDSTTAAARELGVGEETVKTHTKNILAPPRRPQPGQRDRDRPARVADRVAALGASVRPA